MVFINWTDHIGVLIGTATENVTGDLIITLAVILLVLLAFALMFGIPLEFTSIIFLPLCVVYMTYYSQFIAVGGLIILYLSFIITRRFFIFNA